MKTKSPSKILSPAPKKLSQNLKFDSVSSIMGTKTIWSPFTVDLLSGSLAGLVTGALVAPAEYTKVYMQTTDKAARQWLSKKYFSGVFKAPLSFAPLFALVCGVEFSINSRVEKQYGSEAGVVASGITGGVVLSSADHFLYRIKVGQTPKNALSSMWKISPFSLATGATPMIIREMSFMGVMLHIGPKVGRHLQEIFSPATLGDKSSQNIWDSVGRFSTGLVSTALTHPCDSIARAMQVRVRETGKTASLFRVMIEQLSQPKTLMKGVGPRLLLAPVGGATVVSFYHRFKEQVASYSEDESHEKF